MENSASASSQDFLRGQRPHVRLHGPLRGLWLFECDCSHTARHRCGRRKSAGDGDDPGHGRAARVTNRLGKLSPRIDYSDWAWKTTWECDGQKWMKRWPWMNLAHPPKHCLRMLHRSQGARRMRCTFIRAFLLGQGSMAYRSNTNTKGKAKDKNTGV